MKSAPFVIAHPLLQGMVACVRDAVIGAHRRAAGLAGFEAVDRAEANPHPGEESA